ncbi:MAG: flagellar biosynthetic protein FliO [Sphingomonadales bacterium]|jgi:flagellar protein FliO/FliZ|nr:flagellar biosynthetic protein FliO [Sphingomonadales bacterium]MBK9004765.1 flagellar biosynthetic protein FliO [Sphingomonadales bacterium]MBK9267508.1 flagellar biosynthetic protein FliO [Sphingomonadales bacterium]MBP6434450.1 flagellar biosynthetic protein FliO [Sphingorhabdus sp.]
MLEYLLRLALLLPLVGGLAWASLWMWKRLQSGLHGTAPQQRLIRLVEILPVGTGSKLAVVEFGGKLHLLAIGRGTVTAIAIDDRGDFDAS